MDSTIELLTAMTALIVAVGGLLTVVLVQGQRARTEARKTAAEIEAMRRDTKRTVEHVANAHDTNLRADVDDVKAAQDQILANQAELSESLRAITRDVAQIRTELVTDRQARQQLDQQAHDSHKDLYEKIAALSRRLDRRRQK